MSEHIRRRGSSRAATSASRGAVATMKLPTGTTRRASQGSSVPVRPLVATSTSAARTGPRPVSTRSPSGVRTTRRTTIPSATTAPARCAALSRPPR
ncbi:MAG: hypothetical protein IPI38_07800 [Gemmatimonadetes bacterium]|nr:hypothetical protein [Gemmatimonadota bacterium]